MVVEEVVVVVVVSVVMAGITVMAVVAVVVVVVVVPGKPYQRAPWFSRLPYVVSAGDYCQWAHLISPATLS